MKTYGLPFKIAGWSSVEPIKYNGEISKTLWRANDFIGIRVRMMELSPGYLPYHRYEKGHLLPCLEGDLRVKHKEGSNFVFKPGLSYLTPDNAKPHQSSAAVDSQLFIVDGFPAMKINRF